MIRRFKWYSTKIDIPISELSKQIISCQFNNRISEGFLVSRNRKKYIEGKYIQKVVFPEVSEDPFGNIEEREIIKYYITKFILSDDESLGLEIKDPPRSMRAFFAKLQSFTGLGSYITENAVDPLHWAERFEYNYGRIRVSNISSSEINVSQRGLAKISISGEEDIRKDFHNFIGSRKRKIRSIKFSVFEKTQNGHRVIVEFQDNSVAKIFGEYSESILEPIKYSLLEILKNNA